jgi:hypothetical protein
MAVSVWGFFVDVAGYGGLKTYLDGAGNVGRCAAPGRGTDAGGGCPYTCTEERRW